MQISKTECQDFLADLSAEGELNREDLLLDAIAWIRQVLLPEQVFSDDQLRDWADEDYSDRHF